MSEEVGSGLLINSRDLDFLLYEWLHVDQLTNRPEFDQHSREVFDAVLGLSGTLAARYFAPHNAEVDTVEPQVGPDGRVVLPGVISAALKRYREADLPASTFPPALGGMGLPQVIHQAASSLFQAASPGIFGYTVLSAANARLVTAYGTPEQIELFAKPLIAGTWHGTMCLSEPHAGSSLADITTRAVVQPDGTYAIRGSKMWISGGDHELSPNIIHLVLARTGEASEGVRGLSLFIVPKYLVSAGGVLGKRNDVSLVGLNHKMGYRGTSNALLNFGELDNSPGAIGYLIGETGRGLEYMFHMMNEARIAVGGAAAAIGYTGYLRSLAYAKSRTQGRALDLHRRNGQAIAIVDHPDVRRMLLAQKAYVEGALALVLYSALLADESRTAPSALERGAAADTLDLLTPITKSWPSQWCLEANSIAMQVLGGSGYARDFGIEQLYRDNRLNPIHEGTHGVQSLDLLGRKVRAKNGRPFRQLLTCMYETVETSRDSDPLAAAHGGQLAHALERLESITEDLSQAANPAVALANSAVYLEAAGHVVIAWIWLQQELIARGRPEAFYRGKRAAAAYFFSYELPKTEAMFDILASFDRLTTDLDVNVL